MTKISIQFSQLHCESCFLPPPPPVSFSWTFFLFQFHPVSQSLTYSTLLPASETLCHRFPSSFFLFFFSASAYKPETLLPPLPRCGKWRESGKGVITMSIHKHSTPRDCMDESTNATGKLPTQPGTSHLLHSGAPQQTSAYTHAK